MLKTAQEMNTLACHSVSIAKEKAKNEAMRLLTAFIMPTIEKAAEEGRFNWTIDFHKDVDLETVASELTSLGYQVRTSFKRIYISW